MEKIKHVVVGVILLGDRVLCAQRSKDKAFPLKWEFPGAQKEREESETVALIRSYFDMFRTSIALHDEISRYYFEYPKYTVFLIVNHISVVDDMEYLSDHEDIRWVPIDELKDLDWPPASKRAVKTVVKYLNDYREKEYENSLPVKKEDML